VFEEPEVPSTRTWVIHDSQSEGNLLGRFAMRGKDKDNSVMYTYSLRSEHEAVFSGSMAFRRRAQQYSAVGHVGPLALAWHNLHSSFACPADKQPIPGRLVQRPYPDFSKRMSDHARSHLSGPITGYSQLAGASLWIVSASKIHYPVSGTLT
jgi:hypothetical protein